MGTDHIADILKLLVLVTGVASYLIKDGSRRRIAVYALLAACTGLALYTFVPANFKDKDQKGQAVMDSSVAEFVMKLASGTDDILREVSAAGMTSVMSKDDALQKMIPEMHDQAIKAARGAVTKDPASVAMRFRQLVITGESRHPIEEELAALKKLADPEAAPAARIVEELYVQHSVPSAQIEPDLKLVEKLTAHGWLREVASIEVHRNAGEKKLSEKMLDQYHNNLMGYMSTFATLVCVAVGCVLAGMLVLFCQFFFWPRQLTPDQERNQIAAPSDYGFLKVYGVFIGWLALECITSPLLGDLIKPVKKLGGGMNPLTAATIIFVIYTLQNVPALVIVWLVAIKDTGVRFVEAVRLRVRAGTLGPVRLVLSGICAWLAAIPLILVSAVFSKVFMQSHGSASPILPVIAEVVRSGGIVTVILFIFVLGVVPALCEETLFRGFLYTSLRVKHGVFFSVTVSAAAFAAVHMDFGAFVQLFVLGVVFALVMERTKSLLPSMIAHCLWNSGTLILMMAAFGS